MSDRAFKNRAVQQLASSIKAYEDSNPEVGMPPFWQSHVDEAIRRLGISKSEVDYEDLIRRGHVR